MDLHYEIQGEGEAMVLLHSGGADLRDWQWIVPQLAQRYQVITFDGRGAGQSPPLLEPVDYVEELQSLLNHLHLDRAILVGHSIGGQIATDFTLAYPERVIKLILIAPGLSGFQFSPEIQQQFVEIKAAAPDSEKMTELMLAQCLYKIVMASQSRAFMIEMSQHNIQRSFEWKTFEMRWAQPPTIERLSELQPETLFIIGTEDMADNLQVAELFQQAPHIRFAYLEGADHMPTLTHADEVSQLIHQFLNP
jgi:pimeloyl-ACP methyl ester carboxylesterase